MIEQRELYTVTQTPQAGHAVPLPADFDALMQWANVTRRLILAANQNRDTILSIDVIVDDRGRPVRWTSPRRKLLEPSKR